MIKKASNRLKVQIGEGIRNFESGNAQGVFNRGSENSIETRF